MEPAIKKKQEQQALWVTKNSKILLEVLLQPNNIVTYNLSEGTTDVLLFQKR